jgi:hypothetical protein
MDNIITSNLVPKDEALLHKLGQMQPKVAKFLKKETESNHKHPLLL